RLPRRLPASHGRAADRRRRCAGRDGGGVVSAREWRPGDVALVHLDAETEVRCMRTKCGDWASPSGAPYDPLLTARPLVVIDPDDRAQVERLWDLFGAAKAYGPDALQAALRELANPTPPKPDEPTGLGAVVETPGGRYVRSDVETCNPWRGPNGIP